MKKLAITTSLLFLFAAPVVRAEEDASLKIVACDPVVQDLLSEPDGVAVTLKDDGTFQVFARGSGTYDFSDADDVADARKAGELNAKAALTRFLKEEITSSQSLNTVSKKTKVMSSDGTVQTKTATKEQITTLTNSITNSANAILSGMICLKDVKVPGSGSSGQVQVTMGISSKTLEAARRLKGELSGRPSPRPIPRPIPIVPDPNEPEVRKSNTDF